MASLLVSSRLVTLTGPGGIGKTRLAIQAATGIADQFSGGAWLVELAPLVDPKALPDAITAALTGTEPSSAAKRRPGSTPPAAKSGSADPSGAKAQRPSASAKSLAAEIGEQSMLIVLDNCEHLVEPCGHLVDLLLRSCPGLSILATSREPLGVGGEHRWTTGPLSLPDPTQVGVASVKASEAGQLFLQRATASFPGFRLTKATAPAVAEICRRLDGMPLAIELAAARLASLSTTDVLERLDDRFALLTTGSRTVMPRHQTLVATLEWSHDLLSPAEAILLRRTSVFAGWTLDAAQEVCSGDGVERAGIVNHLGALADKSLVVVEAGDDGTMRYRLLESVRLWAAAKLDEASETDMVTRRHGSWCVALAERAEPEMNGSETQLWLDRLDAENDNLHATLERGRAGIDTEVGIRLVTALAAFWRTRMFLAEGLVWLEWARSVSEKSPVLVRAKVLRSTGLFRGMLGNVTSALPLLEESSALFAKAGNHDASLCACNSMFHMFRNPRQSLPELEAEVAACRRSGNTSRLGQFLSTLGQARFSLGDLADARRLFEECVQLGRVTADGDAIRSGLFGLGRVAGLLGDPDAAEAALDEALAQAEENGDADDQAMALGLLGDLTRARGDWERARALLTKSMRLIRAEGSPLSVARAVYFSARLEEAEQVDTANAGALFEEALSLGRAADAPGFHEARCLLGTGSTAQGDDHHGAATGRLLEALELAQAIGDAWASAQALDRLGRLARLDGRLEEADTLARRGLEMHHQMGDLAGIAASLESLAGLAVDADRWQMAARLLAAGQAILDRVGYARSRTDQARHENDLEQVRGALSNEFAEAWAEGTSLSADDAVTYAMRGRGTRGRPPRGWESLTPAERQVVSLVGEGLTNPEVGKRLFVSPRTVGHHLAHVYQKLGIHSRGALIKELAALDPE